MHNKPIAIIHDSRMPLIRDKQNLPMTITIRRALRESITTIATRKITNP